MKIGHFSMDSEGVISPCAVIASHHSEPVDGRCELVQIEHYFESSFQFLHDERRDRSL